MIYISLSGIVMVEIKKKVIMSLFLPDILIAPPFVPLCLYLAVRAESSSRGVQVVKERSRPNFSFLPTEIHQRGEADEAVTKGDAGQNVFPGWQPIIMLIH